MGEVKMNERVVTAIRILWSAALSKVSDGILVTIGL